MPSWLFSKPALLIGGVVLVLSAGGAWLAVHDANERRKGEVAEIIRQSEQLQAAKEIEVAAVRDSLTEARERATTARLSTDTARRAITAASTLYARQRATVNTTAPQPAGVMPDQVVVPRAFVIAADSVMRLVPELLATIARERETSQREREASQHVIESMQALDSLRVQEIAALRIAVQAAKPGVTGHLKDYAIGAGIAAAAFLLLGGRN